MGVDETLSFGHIVHCIRRANYKLADELDQLKLKSFTSINLPQVDRVLEKQKVSKLAADFVEEENVEKRQALNQEEKRKTLLINSLKAKVVQRKTSSL